MSNAETIQIEYTTVEQVATQFDDYASDVNRTLKQLAESLDVLRGGAWIGDNATPFYAEMENDVLPAVPVPVYAEQVLERIVDMIS